MTKTEVRYAAQLDRVLRSAERRLEALRDERDDTDQVCNDLSRDVGAGQLDLRDALLDCQRAVALFDAQIALAEKALAEFEVAQSGWQERAE
jgi:hypothetical protein